MEWHYPVLRRVDIELVNTPPPGATTCLHDLDVARALCPKGDRRDGTAVAGGHAAPVRAIITHIDFIASWIVIRGVGGIQDDFIEALRRAQVDLEPLAICLARPRRPARPWVAIDSVSRHVTIRRGDRKSTCLNSSHVKIS